MSIYWYHSVQWMSDFHMKKKSYSLCSIFPKTETNTKVYSQNELILMETSIVYFHEKFYIPAI